VKVAGTRASVGGGFAFELPDWLLVAVVVVVEPAGAALFPEPVVLVEVTEVEDVVTNVVAVVVEDRLESPHAPTSSAIGITTKSSARRLTFAA
jgi:hypothetical protein